MKFIDFFAGIGGFRLGMQQAGHIPVGYVEIDKFARKSYEVMYDVKDEWTAKDVRKVKPEELPEAEIYTGGFPCQSFSIAGKRGGFEDTRGTLFFEIARLAKEKKPKYLILENVKGLLPHDEGKTFGTILNTLAELGYSIEWQVLNSKDWIPQNRERVYLIGHFREKTTSKIFPIKKNNKEIEKLQRQQNYTNTITARYNGTGTGSYVIEGEQYAQKERKLTPKECWRLQGFPDGLFEKASEVNSDSQLYKQAGNSVTVNVIYEIGRRIKEVNNG